MSSSKALLILIALWAAIYLPGLGSDELKGEEGRRALPGLAMMESGDWIVPTLNGQPYLRKPPLLNWAIAGSVAANGERHQPTEWAARLPSVLAVLGFALVLYWTGRKWLGREQALLGALLMLTCVTFVEKGRLAEIEALYVSLIGSAFAFWIAAWVQGLGGWRLWLLPGVLLGVAMLAKGPTHLIFYYAIIIPVLFASRELRQLRSPAHILSLVVMFGIFAVWAVPYFKAASDLGAQSVWLSQAGNAVSGSTKLSEWLPNFPSALANALPWLPIAGLFWSPAALQRLEERPRLFLKAVRWPLVIGFVGLMAIPGFLPRYTLPLLPVILILFALLLPILGRKALQFWQGVNRFGMIVLGIAAIASPWIVRPAAFPLQQWSDWAYALLVLLALPLVIYWGLRRMAPRPFPLTLGTGLIVAGVIAFMALVVSPRKALRDDLRPVAQKILASTHPDEPIYVIGRAYDPIFFYIPRTLVFEKSPRKIPDNAKQILFRRENLKRVQGRWPQASEATRLEGDGKKDFFILNLLPEREKNPRPESQLRVAPSERGKND